MGGTHLVRDVVLVGVDGLVADGVCLRDELVQLAGGVETGQPDCFAVGGDISAAVVLFLAGVDDWDTIRHDCECGGVLGEGHVVGVSVGENLLDMLRTVSMGTKVDVRGKSGVVVVLHKGSQESRVGAVGLDSVDHVIEIADASAGRLERSEKRPVSIYC